MSALMFPEHLVCAHSFSILYGRQDFLIYRRESSGECLAQDPTAGSEVSALGFGSSMRGFRTHTPSSATMRPPGGLKSFGGKEPKTPYPWAEGIRQVTVVGQGVRAESERARAASAEIEAPGREVTTPFC